MKSILERNRASDLFLFLFFVFETRPQYAALISLAGTDPQILVILLPLPLAYSHFRNVSPCPIKAIQNNLLSDEK